MRVALISNQLGGYDGVSRLAASWRRSLQEYGAEVFEVAGRFGPDNSQVSGRLLVPGLWREGEPFDLSSMAIGPNDYVVVFNALTLASTPSASMSLAEELYNAGVPTILMHIDPPYENEHRTQDVRFPITPEWALNCSITEHSSAEMMLRRGVRGSVMYVPYDSDIEIPGDRWRIREQLGVGADDVLVLHPASAYKRKRIDRAVAFVNESLKSGVRVRYWMTGGGEKDPNYDPQAGQALGDLQTEPVTRRVEKQSDMYAAADAVIMTSDWEGWGMPVIESAAAGRPCLASRYPVLDEIESLGVSTHALTVDNLVKVASGDDAVKDITERNRSLVRIFSSDRLIEDITVNLDRAKNLRHRY